MGDGADEMTVRVMIVDDHAFVREALSAALSARPGFEIVGECADGAAAIDLAPQARPDVMIIDFALGDMAGPDIIAEVRKTCPGARFVLLTGTPLSAAEREALARAADVFLHKESGLDALMAGVEEAAAVPRSRRAPEPAPEGLLAVSAVTARERDVLRALSAGLGVPEIAERLGISPATVRKHRENAMAKLNVNSTAALVRIAVQLGWV
ncbi:MAG: response regulator transcription factor [Oceanicaulis sp.]